MVRWPRHLTASLDDASRREVARIVQAERGTRPVLERAGAVLEFRRGGQLLCGYLCRDPTNRRGYDVIGLDGRRRHLRRDKVVNVSPEYVSMHTPEMALAELRRVDQRREAARGAVDLSVLWQVALEAGPDRDWRLEELVELHDPGEPDVSRRAGMLRALWQGHRFERHGACWRPRSAEAVEGIEAASAREEAESSRQALVASWLRGFADGEPSDPRPPGAEEAISLLESAALEEAGPAAAALMRAANLHGPSAAFDVLVRLGHWSADENLELHRLALPDAFSEAASEAAAGLDRRTVLAGWPRRRRLTSGLCVTACGERAYRLRRSLLGRTIVDIHMAVPALWVEAGGVLDLEAAARGLSVRLPEREIPMLPPELIRACRLTPDEARPILTLSVRLDRELTPGRVRLSRGRARPLLTLEDGGGRPPVARLARLAAKLRRRRRDAGAWEALHAAGEIEVRGGRPLPAAEDPADLIDTELRLLAAEAISRLCHGRVPAVYAVREAPADILPETALEHAEDSAAAEGLRAHLLEGGASRESLGTRSAPHAGLGLPACAAGARPLSSYVDLAMQRQLLSIAGRGPGPLAEGDLERILLETREARESAERVRRSSRRYWTLKWLEGLGGEARLECVVAEARGPGHLVLLAEAPMAAYVPAPRGRRLQVSPGQRLRVRVEQASARRDLLRLAGPERTRGADRDPPV